MFHYVLHAFDLDIAEVKNRQIYDTVCYQLRTKVQSYADIIRRARFTSFNHYADATVTSHHRLLQLVWESLGRCICHLRNFPKSQVMKPSKREGQGHTWRLKLITAWSLTIWQQHQSGVKLISFKLAWNNVCIFQ